MENCINCIICLNQCLIPYEPKLNCECKYSVHKECFMHWWKENNNCLICLKHTNLDMKQPDIYRRRLNNSAQRHAGRYSPNLQYEVSGNWSRLFAARRRRRNNNIWIEISNHVELDDDSFPVLSIRAYLRVFKCMVYTFIVIILCFYLLLGFLYY